ncbi:MULTISPECIES: hypothetical protein [unclassified Breznakia]|uniref:hypothetical protein n=1 Tax=unclassified Breznakia TaxID=2623764 RepID=UPI0024762788|nr:MULTISPECIES: hypothetical protein [unclassified Breznakia]MDH6367035.1 uncharacterized lipoprotein YehR (DUF1307 family) [Breznakia sp. PH1-1]MDH6404193.1 uncharacterized lipoprotein YehR (DUF1307 family) [Breznakia sp. PF1-11]MDH6411922.1 uncharacterized lipoprotein YehR (DUF1307 family) [Breznakia sp. PFB1-11]MDH6414181.1 uncharacterized lipoprotein YehR (DUF1307 family) [Breznakia sp. PFB1-14]MDH6415996.1 uncharacterized lipoprotein YehR (DUF1307 family) [Breznakia sp. PFB1-4]
MKKKVMLMMAMILLLGACGTSSSKKEKQKDIVCTYTTDGITGEFKIVPDGDKIKTMIISVPLSLEEAGLVDASEEDIKNFKDVMKSAIDREGIVSSVDINETEAIMKYEIDVATVEEFPSLMGVGEDGVDEIKKASAKDFAQSLADGLGATCK